MKLALPMNFFLNLHSIPSPSLVKVHTRSPVLKPLHIIWTVSCTCTVNLSTCWNRFPDLFQQNLSRQAAQRLARESFKWQETKIFCVMRPPPMGDHFSRPKDPGNTVIVIYFTATPPCLIPFSETH